MKKLLLLLLLSSNCYAANWICINRAAISCNTWRLEIPEGYLVASDNDATTGGEHAYAMVFVPDVDHKWKLDK